MFKLEKKKRKLFSVLNNFIEFFYWKMIQSKLSFVKGYVYRDYWEDIGTIKSFYEANLALVEEVCSIFNQYSKNVSNFCDLMSLNFWFSCCYCSIPSLSFMIRIHLSTLLLGFYLPPKPKNAA